MNRDEAIKMMEAEFRAGIVMTPRGFVDMLVKLGILKLDEPKPATVDSWTVKVKASERVYVHTFRSVEDGLAELGYSVVPSIEVRIGAKKNPWSERG